VVRNKARFKDWPTLREARCFPLVRYAAPTNGIIMGDYGWYRDDRRKWGCIYEGEWLERKTDDGHGKRRLYVPSQHELENAEKLLTIETNCGRRLLVPVVRIDHAIRDEWIKRYKPPSEYKEAFNLVSRRQAPASRRR